MTQTDSYIIEDRKVLKEIVDITRQEIVRELYDKHKTQKAKHKTQNTKHKT